MRFLLSRFSLDTGHLHETFPSPVSRNYSVKLKLKLRPNPFIERTCSVLQPLRTAHVTRRAS